MRKHLQIRHKVLLAIVIAIVLGGVVSAQSSRFNSLFPKLNFFEEEEDDDIYLDEDEAALFGEILDSEGEPFPLAQVKLHSEDGETYTGISDEEGYYSISGIPSDTYEVEVLPSPYGADMIAPEVDPVALEGGEETELNLQFTSGQKIIAGSLKFSNGKPITNASIVALRKSPAAYLSAKVDENGKFNLSTSGGLWKVVAVTKDPEASWTKIIGEANFDAEDAGDTVNVDLVAAAANSRLTGNVLNPDGSAPKSGTVVKLSTGQETTVESDGSFVFSVTSDAFTLTIIPSDLRISAPDPLPVTVAAGEEFDVGTIELIRDDAHIRGTVKNSKTGKPISGVTVQITMSDSSNFQTAQTNSEGSYDALVSDGSWTVSVLPVNGFITDGAGSTSVSIEEQSTTTADFNLSPVQAAVSGTLNDEKGKPASDISGYLSITASDGQNFGTDIVNGAYTVKIVPGKYEFRAILPPDAAYTAGDPAGVAIGENDKTKEVNLKVLSNKYAINGAVKDDAGKIIKEVRIQVFGSDGEGNWQQTETTDGTFSLAVSKGEWTLGCTGAEGADYIPLDPSEVKQSVIVKNGNITKDCVLKRANSTITGNVQNDAGKPLSHVYISVDAASADQDNKEAGKTFVASAESDDGGSFTVSVPKGTYYLHAYQQAIPGLISPDEQAVTVSGGQAQNVTLVFKQAQVPVSGVVEAEGKPQTGVLVSAWSENGGYVQTETDAKGNYSLNVDPATWHVSAALDLNGKGYKASAVEIVARAGEENSLNLTPLPMNVSLAPPVVTAANAAAGSAIEMKNGATAVLPGGAAGSSGKITFNMSQVVEAANQSTGNIFGAAYNVELRDSKGKVITQLNDEAVIALPYDQKALKAGGTKPENLIPSYWDGTVGAWRKVKNVVLDKKEHTLTFTTTHFTRFALVSPADETPPSAPASVAVKTSGSKLVLNWKNPSADFHHVKIYESEQKGSLGRLIADNIAKSTFETKAPGKTVYFVVRSVDLAGNESKNLNQFSASGGVKRK